MHSYSDLIYRSTAFSLNALEQANKSVIEALQTSAETTLVKTLQMVQLQKGMQAVGMFSMFEAILQDGLSCANGFHEAGDILANEGKTELKERFEDLQLAVNVLKHGQGRSYNALVAKAGSVPFRVKLPNEAFFAEGDVSEVLTLIEVDDAFVLGCAEVIHEVSAVIRQAQPGIAL